MSKGWQRQLAKAITRLEASSPREMARLATAPLDKSGAKIIGVTGPPGGGKSTLCNQLVKELAWEHKVAAILVDPSSPFSGGAILGDRIRMQSLSDNPNIFIRSLSNRGNSGGVSRALVSILRLLLEYGFEYIVIETIGAGQSEVKIASIADTTMVVAVPNLGDDIQAVKSGIMEIADIFILNKADLPGADSLFRQLRDSTSSKAGWQIPLCQTTATTGEGIDNLLEQINSHHQWLVENDLLTDKRKQAAKFEIVELSSWMLQQHLDKVPAQVLASRLAEGDYSIYSKLDSAYREMLETLGEVKEDV